MIYGWDAVEKQHIIDLLAALKDLFADQDKWIQWPRAESSAGLPVDPTSDQAVRWCLMGAGEMLGAKMFEKPLDLYVECATRDLLDEMSDGKFVHGMDYNDEYALICLAHEHLIEGENK